VLTCLNFGALFLQLIFACLGTRFPKIAYFAGPSVLLFQVACIMLAEMTAIKDNSVASSVIIPRVFA